MSDTPRAFLAYRSQPERSTWTPARQRKYPDLYSLWLRQESGFERGECFVCGRSWTVAPLPGCGGCRSLRVWWPHPGTDLAATPSCPAHGGEHLKAWPNDETRSSLRWWECRADDCTWHELRHSYITVAVQPSLFEESSCA